MTYLELIERVEKENSEKKTVIFEIDGEIYNIEDVEICKNIIILHGGK